MHRILNQAIQTIYSSICSKHMWMPGAGIVLLIGMATAFGTTREAPIYAGQFIDSIDELSRPLAQVIVTDPESYTREVRIQSGDTVSTLFARMGVDDRDALAFINANPSANIVFRQLAPGKALLAGVSRQGKLRSLTFPLNGEKDLAIQIDGGNGTFSSSSTPLPVESNIVLQSASIQHSLFGATDDAGIPDSVAVELANIFSGDIDFHRDLRKGDSFSVIYETVNLLGKPIRVRHILAAEFVNDGKTYRAFWYENSPGKGGYYTADGRSVKKAFLRSPLEFSRITSGFSNARYHPVLLEMRAHRGIDYGAPIGTRVKATGNGVIDFVGWKGGYGKVILVRHPGDKTTAYGHLSGFAAGTRKGARVSQGDVIGFVGATGMATGPHLHYEFRIAGIHRNPLTVALPPAEPLPKSQMSDFHAHVNDLITQLASIRDWRLVSLD